MIPTAKQVFEENDPGATVHWVVYDDCSFRIVMAAADYGTEGTIDVTSDDDSDFFGAIKDVLISRYKLHTKLVKKD